MTTELTDLEERWHWLRHHPAVRAAGIYVGSAWVLVQALALFGAPLQVLRIIAVVLLVGLAAMLVVFWQIAARGKAERPNTKVFGLRSARGWVITVLLLVVGTAAWFARPRREVSAGADVIAVLPFSTTGAAAVDLGEGMVDLMSASLDQTGPIRTLSARTVLREWRARAGRDQEVTPEEAIEIARQLGAASVLTGSAVAVGQSIKLTAVLQNLTGATLAEATVTGQVDSVFQIVDALTVQLLEDVWRGRDPVPTVRVSAITTTSLPAIRAFLRGARFFRASRFDSARVAYDEALTADSTFALAWQQLSLVTGFAGGTHGSPLQLQYAQAASRHASRLPARDHRLLTAQLLHAEGQLAAFDSLRAYTSAFPDDVAGWYLLADAHFHAQYMLGLRPAEVLAPFERVLALDSTLAPAVIHPLDAGLWNHERDIVDRFLPRAVAVFSPELLGSYKRMRAVAFAPVDSALDALSGAPSSGAGSTRVIYPTWIVSMRVARSAEPASVLLQAADRIGAIPGGQGRAAALRMMVGRLDQAFHRDGPDSLTTDVTRAQAALGSIGGLLSPTQISEWTAQVPPAITVATTIQRFVLALAANDLDRARAIVNTPLPDSVARSAIMPGTLQAMRGWLDYASGKPDAGLHQIRDGLHAAGYSTARTLGPMGPFRFIYAVALTRKPETRAEGMVRLNEFESVHGMLAVPAQIARAEALEASGDAAGAVAAYQNVVRLWRDADAHLQPTVQRAAAAIARLQPDRHR